MSYEEPSGPELVIQHTGQIFSLGTEPVTIGSQPDNIMVLADPKVSPYHATIYWHAETGNYLIEDLGSAEGTYLNEVPVEGAQLLRHGDVLRLGDTVIDLRLKPAQEAAAYAPLPLAVEESESSSRNPVLIGILVVLLAGVVVVCVALFAILLFGGGQGTPDVIIQSPTDGAQIAAGNEIILQATASGAKDITSLALSVDGTVVATTSNPNGASMLTVSKPWVFADAGEHTISAQATTASGKTSRPASVTVIVVAAGKPPTATPTPKPGQPTDTPAPEDTETPTPTPTPLPEDTATPLPTDVPPPQIEYFQGSPASINAGECTTLQWGVVSNATEAVITPDIGGVGTPGSQQVCPLETTTYILTANGPGGTSQASTTVTVIGGLPDLTVDLINLIPNPAVAGEDNEVQITIRNAGIGDAGAFNWRWQAGTDATFDGRIPGLAAGESTLVTIIWNPLGPYDRLTTEAVVDTDNEIVESDENNNQLMAAVQVVEGVSQPVTVTVKSSASLDGYRLNDGSGSTGQDILAGNGELADPLGELVARGFMSFDLSGIPADATIESVELRFYQKKIQGDPYGKLGNLVLELVNYGSSLDDNAYSAPSLASAALAAQSLPGEWYVLSDPTIVSWVQSNLAAGRTQFQLRLQFMQETDGDGLEDWAAFEAGGGVLGSRNSPAVTITYVP